MALPFSQFICTVSERWCEALVLLAVRALESVCDLREAALATGEEFWTGERRAGASSGLLPLEEALSQQRALPVDARGKVGHMRLPKRKLPGIQ